MAKLKELKEKYPHLAISLLDVFSRLDTSKTNKYTSLICRVLDSKIKEFPINKEYELELKERLSNYGVPFENLNNEEIRQILRTLEDRFNFSDLRIINRFIEFMDKGLIAQNDILKYKNLEDVRNAVSVCEMSFLDKELQSEVIKVYEDDVWVFVRPLTHQSSMKYGSTTRWSTTSTNDPSAFYRYWNNGVLIYFMNKVTGYKFAGYKSLEHNEYGFWDAEDNRIDFLQTKTDDYLMPIIKDAMSSNSTNSDLCPMSLRSKVREYCELYPKSVIIRSDAPDEPVLIPDRDSIGQDIYIDDIIEEDEMDEELWKEIESDLVYLNTPKSPQLSPNLP